MRPLRFCMVTTFYPPYSFGGDGIFVHRLSHALAERGHRIDVIHSEDAYRLQTTDEPQIGFAEHPNVTRHALRSRRPRWAALSAHQLGGPAVYSRRLQQLLSADYDVIHYHNVSLMGGPGVFRYGRAVKLCTAHEYWLVCPTHVLFRFDREACVERRCLRCTLHARRPPQLWRYTGTLARGVASVDRLLMPSRFALERHQADGIESPMTVLPSFVPTPATAEGEAPVADRPFFLFVGRLEKLKGVQDLLKLFRDYRGADLLVVGEGSYRPVLEQAARGLDHVRFVGALHPTEIGAYYRQAIAVLVPSLCYEVFPLIPVEALAHGTPVISRRIGALTEVIDESGGGLGFDTLDQCREAMARLQAEPELRARLGASGRHTAETRWTTEVHLARYLEIVGDLLEAPRS